MSVSSIGSSLATASQQVTSGKGTAPSAIATAVQEANETPQVTAKEAQQGDPVARRKLQQIQARQRQQQDLQATQQKSAEPGKGAAVDHEA